MENSQTDALSKIMASTLHDLHVQLFFDVVKEPSISKVAHVLHLDVEPCWIDSSAQYLMTGLFR